MPLYDFQLATTKNRALIKSWWTKPHIMEFWDNSPDMWQNLENYFAGKKELFDYWLGFLEEIPFALFMTSKLEKNLLPDDPYNKWLATKGPTLTLDFMIGEETFLGKGFGARVLREFMFFLNKKEAVSTFLIDPATHNTKAIHVYEKAGFHVVDRFIRKQGYFAGIEHLLMKMEL
jgi:RimJ/RimL family protein N-acetyltransferase